MQRGKHNVPPGSIDGHEDFNRHYRSQANLLEALMMFLPPAWILGHFGSATLAGVLTLVFLVGRVLYHRAYVTDPATRTKPFMIGIGSTAVVWVAATAAVLIAAVR